MITEARKNQRRSRPEDGGSSEKKASPASLRVSVAIQDIPPDEVRFITAQDPTIAVDTRRLPVRARSQGEDRSRSGDGETRKPVKYVPDHPEAFSPLENRVAMIETS
jgi:hypothetical protein